MKWDAVEHYQKSIALWKSQNEFALAICVQFNDGWCANAQEHVNQSKAVWAQQHNELIHFIWTIPISIWSADAQKPITYVK